MAHNKKLSKALWVVGWTALLSIIFFTLLLIYWLVQPYTLPYIQEPIKILNENRVIKIGEPIKMELNISKPEETRAINQSPRIECQSGNLVTLVGSAKELPAGAYTIISDHYVLPPKVLPGDTCKFIFQTTYEINPLKTVKEDWASETFLIGG